METRYQVVLHRAAAEQFLQMPRKNREDMLRFLEQLETNPGQRGDYEEYDESGRRNQIRLHGGWAITYWPDHAVKEIRVVRLEKAD